MKILVLPKTNKYVHQLVNVKHLYQDARCKDKENA
jgi:hypothetical protein